MWGEGEAYLEQGEEDARRECLWEFLLGQPRLHLPGIFQGHSSEVMATMQVVSSFDGVSLFVPLSSTQKRVGDHSCDYRNP